MATVRKTTPKAAATKTAAKRTTKATKSKTTVKKRATKKELVKAVGRHPITFDYDEVERLAGLGLTREKIAIALGCCTRTLQNRIVNDSDFADAIARGSAKREAVVASKLAERCDDGDVSAIKFFLQAVCKWSERQELQVQADVSVDASVSVKDMTTEQLQAAIAKLEKA